MKNNKIIILVIAIQMILLLGCIDWLNLPPEDAVPKNEYWITKEVVASAMTGIY